MGDSGGQGGCGSQWGPGVQGGEIGGWVRGCGGSHGDQQVDGSTCSGQQSGFQGNQSRATSRPGSLVVWCQYYCSLLLIACSCTCVSEGSVYQTLSLPPSLPPSLPQMHCWDDGTPLEETLQALNDLVIAGKIHYVGVSNVTGWQFQRIVDMCREKGLNQIVSNQVGRTYSAVPLFQRPRTDFSRSLIFGCKLNGWQFTASCMVKMWQIKSTPPPKGKKRRAQL